MHNNTKNRIRQLFRYLRFIEGWLYMFLLVQRVVVWCGVVCPWCCVVIWCVWCVEFLVQVRIESLGDS